MHFYRWRFRVKPGMTGGKPGMTGGKPGMTGVKPGMTGGKARNEGLAAQYPYRLR